MLLFMLDDMTTKADLELSIGHAINLEQNFMRILEPEK